MAVTNAVRDFSRPRKRLNFTIDGEEFDAWPALPVDLLFGILEISSKTFVERDKNAMRDMFAIMLQPESFGRFEPRLSNPRNPIDITQIDNIIEWLLEEYGNRPTAPSENSSDGSSNPDAGTNSTVNLPLGELTSVP